MIYTSIHYVPFLGTESISNNELWFRSLFSFCFGLLFPLAVRFFNRTSTKNRRPFTEASVFRLRPFNILNFYPFECLLPQNVNRSKKCAPLKSFLRLLNKTVSKEKRRSVQIRSTEFQTVIRSIYSPWIFLKEENVFRSMWIVGMLRSFYLHDFVKCFNFQIHWNMSVKSYRLDCEKVFCF